jgi:hypothetical protein
MSGALFTIAPMIPAGDSPRGGHQITADELLLTAQEACEQPCVVLAKHTKLNGREKIKIQISYKTPRPTKL